MKRKGYGMLWEVTITPKGGSDQESNRVREEYNLLTHSQVGDSLVTGNAFGYLLEGNLSTEQVDQLVTELLVDPLTQESALQIIEASGECEHPGDCSAITVLLKPGVMDPVAQSVTDAAHDLGIP